MDPLTLVYNFDIGSSQQGHAILQAGLDIDME